MFEARLDQAELLKKVLDAVKELVTDANFDCSDEGIKLQAMDNSHVALVSLELQRSGFAKYRCDRDMSLGMSLASLQKIIKCAANNDTITLRADDNVDVLALLFEAKKQDRVGEYEMKLMDIDQEHLGIPDTVYDAEISLPATEFARIIRDLKELGESVKIEVSKDGVRFSAEGDIGTASVTLKQGEKRGAEDSDEDEEDEENEDEENEDEDEEEEPKEEDEDGDVVIENGEEDKKPEINGDDAEENGDDVKSEKAGSESPKKKRKTIPDDEEDEDDEEVQPKKKAKKAIKKEKKPAKKPAKKAAKKDTKEKSKKGKKGDSDEEKNLDVEINLQQAVSLTFSIKYLLNFAKSTPLSERVRLHMSNEVPLLVEYPFSQGHIRYYLAPKIAED